MPPRNPDGKKGWCDGRAHTSCDEEERMRTVQPGGNGGGGGGGATGTGKLKSSPSSTIQLAPPPGKPSEEVVGVPSTLVVEGNAPSGDRTVLGVDVTYSIAEVAELYAGRNVRGCKPIEDLYSRVLCLDPPGGGSDSVIELEFYRGRLIRLTYDAPLSSPVKLRPAVSVAEEKTGARAMLSTQGTGCRARFALAGGTMALTGGPSEGKGEPCLPANVEAATLSRVEWAPGTAVQREVSEQRKNDHSPAQQKKDEVNRTKALLPL